MLEWKDRWWCSRAKSCANAKGCNRVLSEAEQTRAHHEGFLICWVNGCSKYKKKEETK